MAIIRHRYNDYGAEYGEIVKYVVNYKDVLQLKPLYELMHKWLVDEGYGPVDDSQFKEVFYLSKDTQAGREIWTRWRLTKDPFPDPSKQKFWRFDWDIDMHVLTMKDVEVMINNKKVKAQKGEVEITVVANIVKDWEREWGKHPILKFFKGLAQKKLLRKTESRLKSELYDDAYRFRDMINNFLQIKTFIGSAKGGAEYWPKKLPE